MKKFIVKDFPKKGIDFLDITKVFSDPESFQELVDRVSHMDVSNVEYVVGVEARGFILATMISTMYGIPLILARKSNKLPTRTIKMTTISEYDSVDFEIAEDDMKLFSGKEVLVVDDVVATGGTMGVISKTLYEYGAIPRGVAIFLIEGFKKPENFEVEILFPDNE